MKKILRYLNPIAQLGNRRYSFLFPFLVILTTCVLLEIFTYYILRNSEAVGLFAIFIPIAFIVYFAFRDGIRGGIIVTFLTILYYFYIIYTRHHTGQQLITDIETTAVLGLTYLLMAVIIGWLKQTIDKLIEREANEKRRLQAIVQQLPVGVVITDNKGKVTQVNKQVEAIFGVKTPLGYTIGKDEALVKSKQKNKYVGTSHSPLIQALNTGKQIVGKEFIIERKDGKEVYVQISSSPIHNKDGKIIAAVSIYTDITQQRELEERKDDFVNMASHELKTPITSMKLYIDSLLIQIKKSRDEKALKTISSIKYQTNRLQELASELLDVSRLQTGKLSMKKEEFRLDNLVEETLNELQGTTKEHNIIFSKKIQLKVFGDKFRLYQVITNLITNAIKYSPKDTDIVIRLKREQGKAIMSVRDSGIGIAKAQQKKIFDRLYQVTDPKEKTFPGLGMGLYITKEIIKRHKGNIWLESEKEKGSTFYFSLPIQKQKG